MADTPFLRNRSVRLMSMLVSLGGTAAGIALSAWALYGASKGTQGGGNDGLLLGAGLTLTAVSLFLYALLELAIQAENNISRVQDNTEHMVDLLRQMQSLMQKLCRNSELSDEAKSIAHRERERETLRQAIREEMYGGDLEAVHYLINEMERRFGYKQEAEALRKEVAQLREMTIDQKISEAIAHIEKLMADHRWSRAAQESERLAKLFPRHERVQALPGLLTQRREQRKQELLAEWRAAVQREEVDKGISLLTELDAYLTSAEAQQLQESARHVFKARLLNLGVQFGLAVSEQRWRDALEVGLMIRQEFPNSRMAHEVSDKLETLRVRAGFVADAEIVQRRPAPPAAKS